MRGSPVGQYRARVMQGMLGEVLCTPSEPVPCNALPQEPQGSSCLELAVSRETSDWGRGEVTLKGGIQ